MPQWRPNSAAQLKTRWARTGLVSNRVSLRDSGKRCGREQAKILAGRQDRGSVLFCPRSVFGRDGREAPGQIVKLFKEGFPPRLASKSADHRGSFRRRRARAGGVRRGDARRTLWHRVRSPRRTDTTAGHAQRRRDVRPGGCDPCVPQPVRSQDVTAAGGLRSALLDRHRIQALGRHRAQAHRGSLTSA
jgi:hypothetical protein